MYTKLSWEIDIFTSYVVSKNTSTIHHKYKTNLFFSTKSDFFFLLYYNSSWYT